MTILFFTRPGSKYRGRLEGQERDLPVRPLYEHCIETKTGNLFTETYQNIGHGLSPYRMLAVYVGIKRSSELPRHFDPSRLV